MPLLQAAKNLLSSARDAVASVFVNTDRAKAVALGVTIGEKIAHWQRSGQGFLWSRLSETDETETHRANYRRMLAEPAIKAALYSKLYAVASLDLTVQPAEEDPNGAETAAFLRHALLSCRGGIRKIIESIIFPGLIEGYSLAGKVWRQTERGRYAGRVVLADLKSYDSRDYRLKTDAYKNVTGVQSRVDNADWPLSDFAYWTHLPLFENPHGQSDLRAAHRQYLILTEAWKFWAIALERYTLPMMMGKYPKDQVQLKAVLDTALKEARALGYITAPDGTDVSALEMALSAGPSFAQAIDELRKDVFLGITGAFLQSLEGSTTGARSIGEVHQSSAELLVWYLADCAAGVINDQIIPQLIDWNLGGNVPYPSVTLASVNDESLLPSLQLDHGLQQLGMELSLSERRHVYRRGAPKDASDALRPVAAPAPFAEEPADAEPFRLA